MSDHAEIHRRAIELHQESRRTVRNYFIAGLVVAGGVVFATNHAVRQKQIANDALSMAFADATTVTLTGPHTANINYGIEGTSYAFNFNSKQILMSEVTMAPRAGAGAGGNLSFKNFDAAEPNVSSAEIQNRACEVAEHALTVLDPERVLQEENYQIAVSFGQEYC